MNQAIERSGSSAGSLKSYAIGFVLAVVLTIISFALVMSRAVSHPVALVGIIIAAVVQILVHLHYFLHLDRSSEKRWNMVVLVFTVLIMFIFIGGSSWVMFTLNARMM